MPTQSQESGLSPPQPLSADALHTIADLSGLAFETTDDLKSPGRVIGQDRAMGAVELGSAVSEDGFNIFVIGHDAMRLRDIVREQLRARAAQLPAPPDWVYVNNFVTPHKPVAIKLPAGRAPSFHGQMHELIQDLKIALPAAFEGGDFQGQKDVIDDQARHKQEATFAELRDRATERDLAIVRSPMGFGLVPVRDGKVLPPDEFPSLSKEEQQAVETAMRELEPLLEKAVRSLPTLEKERRDALRKLTRETAQSAVQQSIDELKRAFNDLPEVITYLEAVRGDIGDNVGMFLAPQSEDGIHEGPAGLGGLFDRYEVNVLITGDDRTEHAPVVEESHATLGNLVGRIEHIAQQGALVTNFRLIKGGALHRANGGFLLVDARSLVTEALSWPALKRAMQQKKIEIEDISRALGFSSTVSLEPDAIPLAVKVVLFGDRMLYYLLRSLDPDVARHFKVLADFDDDIDRSTESEAELALLIADIVKQQKLRPVSRDGVIRIIEQASRLTSDREKLSLFAENFSDILIEANHWAGTGGASIVHADHVEQAIEQRLYRAGRIEEKAQESILRDIALVDTTGQRTGQINGLSVLSIGGHSFGKPTRITCRVRPGIGKIVDIEREVELGGPTHSKGVLILSGFLAGRYALDSPMSLYASIVFEQSYGGVDGDSASSAELYALLSSLSELPLNQQFAVTGSVNQQGDVQAIGGVNEKIEGFFDVCTARALTGTQGVLIPKSNVQHLVLRKDVRVACAIGKFSIYPIETIDQGIGLLTGRQAGSRGLDGKYPTGSVNRIVEDKLEAFAAIRKQSVSLAHGSDGAAI